jgi:hypothetical protein
MRSSSPQRRWVRRALIDDAHAHVERRQRVAQVVPEDGQKALLKMLDALIALRGDARSAGQRPLGFLGSSTP